MFACPISFISLIGENEQWFKASCGLDVDSTPRGVALCNYTILSDDIFTVEDARADERFAGNPLVWGSPGIRFYAGVPIRWEGTRLGAICIADTRPRQFTSGDLVSLRGLGHIAEALVASHADSVRIAASAQLVWRQNQLLQQVEKIGKIGGWEMDLATEQVVWSDEISRIHELPSREPCGLEAALSFYPGHWRAMVEQKLAHARATGESYSFDAEFVTAQGNHKWVRAAGECEKVDGKPRRLFGIFQDITNEKAAAERMWLAANYDEVTGLANRRLFNTWLAEGIARCERNGGTLLLLLLDLDNFKTINDTRGHGVGDAVLAQIGERLRGVVPPGGSVARLGGDEFAVILTATPDANAGEERAKVVLNALRKPIRIDGFHLYVGGTVGVARYPQDAATASDLLKRADIGLYSAKQIQPGTAMGYRPEMAQFFDQHGQAMDAVRTALAQRRLAAFYQPKVRLSDGGLAGFEALVRVVAPDGAVLGPSTFASVFTDRTISRRIGRRMLEAVTSDLAAWHAAGFSPLSVSLNVNEYDLADPQFAKRLLHALDGKGLPRSCLTVEVTESVFLGDRAALAKDALFRLDNQGIGVELDDFGTGYASLTHLRAIPVSRLKIDRSFVESLERDAGDRTIVEAIIALGHKLGHEIVAEGIESASQAELLRSMGCDLGQGFHFGQPADAGQARKLLLAEALARETQLRKLARGTGSRTIKAG